MKEDVSPNVETTDRAPETIRPFLTKLAQIEIEKRPFGDVVKEMNEVAVEVESRRPREAIEIGDGLGKWMDRYKNDISSELGLKIAYLSGRVLMGFLTYKSELFRPEDSRTE